MAGEAKRIATLIVLALCTVGLFLGISHVFIPKNNQAAFGMEHPEANGFMGEPSNSLDVLFIGDSEAFSTFSPMQLYHEQGFTSYVSATSGQRLTYGSTLLERACKTQRPKVVVFETNSIYAPFSFEDVAKQVIENAFPFFTYHDRWKSLHVDDLVSSPHATWTDDLKGFRINKGIKAADTSGHMAPASDTLEIPAVNRTYLESMVKFCRAHGATPVLVSTPSTVNWNTPRHNGIARFAQEMGVEYIDLNVDPSKVNIDWTTETYDGGDHLNYAGATKVSSYLGNVLKTKYKLPDHREDTGFSAWDDAYARYEKQVAETQ